MWWFGDARWYPSREIDPVMGAPEDPNRDHPLVPFLVYDEADLFWPEVVQNGYEIHVGHRPGDVCNPERCCVVSSLDGLGEFLDDQGEPPKGKP